MILVIWTLLIAVALIIGGYSVHVLWGVAAGLMFVLAVSALVVMYLQTHGPSRRRHFLK